MGRVTQSDGLFPVVNRIPLGVRLAAPATLANPDVHFCKEELLDQLRAAGHKVVDFGAHRLSQDDDYPDYVVPLARAVVAQEVERRVAVYGSGVGAAVCANVERISAMAQETKEGRSAPLGATLALEGANFSVYAKHATVIELLLFDCVDDARPTRSTGSVNFVRGLRDPGECNVITAWTLHSPARNINITAPMNKPEHGGAK